jgi:hypothetical protein
MRTGPVTKADSEGREMKFNKLISSKIGPWHPFSRKIGTLFEK